LRGDYIVNVNYLAEVAMVDNNHGGQGWRRPCAKFMSQKYEYIHEYEMMHVFGVGVL
jgi:hypothetical protein